jgi:hypothetical protein
MAIPRGIEEEILNINTDIRAEILVDQILQNKVNWNELFINYNKFFYRSFSKDVYNTKIDEENNFRPVLQINLTRAGIYDLIPEGIFFQPNKSSRKPNSASEMAEEYKINKKQEIELRKFFSPLENEFFYHRYKNFKTEKAILNGLNNDDLNKYYIKFWNLAKDIPPTMALKLVLLLPFVHQITGDINLMASSLQSVIGESVLCYIKNEENQTPSNIANILGKFELGNELICGNQFQENEICFVFILRDLIKSNIQDYLEGGSLYKTLHTFYRFFLPVNAEIKTEFSLSKIKKQMQIGLMEEATLGIMTVI